MRAQAEDDAPPATGRWRPSGTTRRFTSVPALAGLLAVVAGAYVPGPVTAQGTAAVPEIEEHRLLGLRFRAPSPLEETSAGAGALERAVGRSEAIEGVEFYLWDGGSVAVTVGRYSLTEGADYDLERGLRGALDRLSRRIGVAPETGPNAYGMRRTSVSGHPARTGSRRVSRDGTSLVGRTLVTRAGRSVWIVSVVGADGRPFRAVSEALFGSLSVDR